MHREQRIPWREFAVELHGLDGTYLWNLCALCRFRSWDEQGDPCCTHPLEAARGDPDHLLPGADCWAFRPAQPMEEARELWVTMIEEARRESA